MLTTVVLAIKNIPIYACPTMNTAMYENDIVQENMAKLSKHGYLFIDPKESLLACGDLGKGALADVELITATILKQLENKD